MLCAVCMNKLMGALFPLAMLALIIAIIAIAFKLLGYDLRNL